MPDRSHGSPYDRGDSDRYYGRRHDPHKWTFPGGNFARPVKVYELTPEELAEYDLGWEENPSDIKVW